jgi:uncharacterized membrane protein YgcG
LRIPRRLRWLLALAAVVAIGTLVPECSSADQGWVIRRFDTTITVDADARLLVRESLEVDFRELERHGIFRDIPYLYALPDNDDEVRVTTVIVRDVTNAGGEPVEYSDTAAGAYRRVRIGDADVTVTGVQTYVITYEVRRAMNPFADHDELGWNITGDQWPVPVESSTARVTFEEARISAVSCYRGRAGSTEACGSSTATGSTAAFVAGRALEPGEGWTAYIALPKGAVAVPPLEFGPAPPDPPEVIEAKVRPGYLMVTTALPVLAFGFGLVSWYRSGRDRKAQVANADGPVVVEYEPPEDLRPAEMDALLRERTSRAGVGLTLVDLAARGYIEIDAVDDGRDYRLHLKQLDDRLAKFEWTLLDGLFKKDKEAVTVSHLRKQRFHRTVQKAQREIDVALAERGYFVRDPQSVRDRFSAKGWALFGVAIGLAIAAGISMSVAAPLAPVFGDGPLNAVLGLLVVGGGLGLAGAVLAVFARWMPARTAKGFAAYRRVFGFRRFMEVADSTRQQFYEREGIFERYLPYAMVFGIVDRWAAVFGDLGIPLREPSYFHAAGQAFDSATFTSVVSSFQGSVSRAGAEPVSTSGGSGSSGFSSSSSSSSSFGGGSSGGGTGGGGGGSW